MTLKQLSNLLFAISFICALLILLEKTYGNRGLIQTIFFVSGGIALVVSLVAARTGPDKHDFNVLFWIGNLVMFIGFLMKMQYSPLSTFVLIGGMIISAIANFYNPFQANKRHDENDLLDR